MITYIIRRCILIVPTLLGITAVVFFVMAFSPGNPAQMMADQATGEVDAEVARAIRAYYEERYGLDQPPIMQYGRWLHQISPIGVRYDDAGDATGFGFKAPNLGYSFVRGRSVLNLIRDALPITILLNVLSVPLVYVIAVVSGIYAARHRGGLFDVTTGTTFLALWSIPTIWAGVLLIGFVANEDFVRWFPAEGLSDTRAHLMPFLPTSASAVGQVVGFALYMLTWCLLAAACLAILVAPFWMVVGLVLMALRQRTRPVLIGAGLLGIGVLVGALTSAVLWADVLPTQMPAERGYLLDRLWHLALPVLCLSYTGFAFLSKLARGAVLENLHADFARTARAKGLDDRTVLFRHVVRNSLLPLITVSVAIIPGMLGGSIIVESIFSIDGMGRLAVQAVFVRDRELVMAITLIGGLLGLLSILLTDICYAIADPRVSYD